MDQTFACAAGAILIALSAPALSYAQGNCQVKHLAIFDADAGEFLEERTVDLQAGANNVEWRNVTPQAIFGTLRVTADQADVIQQRITMEGSDPRGARSAILQLKLQNTGQPGPHKIRLDYLASKVSWKADYWLVLSPSPAHQPPREMTLDGWVAVKNETGADVCADAVDLIAGDVQLLNSGNNARSYTANMQAYTMNMSTADAGAGMEISQVSVFSRLALGRDLLFHAGALMERFPLFQHARFPVEQRNVFESEPNMQTLGKGGFTLATRGLEVRLVSKNATATAIPAGTVTIYSPDAGIPQVVGQDRIPLTPPGADFTVSQGRSNLLQGTRRIVERSQLPDIPSRPKLVTRVEVVIENHGPDPSVAYIREGVENFGNGAWTVTQASHPQKKLSDRSMEFKVDVPAGGRTAVQYTVEIH